MPEQDLLINPLDFRSIRIEIDLQNNTTQTTVSGGRKTYDSIAQTAKKSDQWIEFVEFQGEKLILDCPENVAAVGHRIEFQMHPVGVERIIRFGGSAKVVEVKPLENGRCGITLELAQYNKSGYKAIQELFSMRQDEINDFFQAVKG